ncbi:MAG: translation initiation factor IF-2 [Streptococcaceae bacterium]|jgi:translation initiation factor IF-2|nr:translation initiation factor IF-2 [Streptococcaceae bacterium]
MSEKKRINEIAKETGFKNQDLVEKAKELGFDIKSHSSSLSEAEGKQLLTAMGKETAEKVEKKAPAKKQTAKPDRPKAGAKGDEPLTFQGKAVVIDPAILARAKAKEAEKAGSTEVATKGEAKKPRIKVVASVEDQEKARAIAEKVAETNKAVEKVLAKAEAVSAKTAEKVAKPQKVENQSQNIEVKEKVKKPLSTRPKIAIKVVKRAEEQPKFSERPLKDRLKKEAGQVKNAQSQGKSVRQGQGQRPFQKKQDQQHGAKVQKTEFTPAAIDTRTNNRRKGNKDRDNNRSEAKDNNRFGGGPLRVNDNRNQVRNARNSNWNAGGRRRNKDHNVSLTERKFVELPESLEYSEGMTIADIAKRIHRESAEIVKKLFMMGVMATQNQSLDEETIELLLMDYGITPEKKVQEDKADIERLFVEEGYLNEENMISRPPVVTIMGHVDHGKTTLLDHLRKNRTNVTEGEAGGITQHIGAYQIDVEGKKITFLDTPGHEAFTSMRARGASVTDITILVVAADDGVMPQTIEAINHSRAAGVPIIVAINKIDKQGANPQKVINELAEHNVLSTAWGGDSEFVEISAKFDKNIDSLLETVLLVAEMQELKADPTVRAIGTVIEARLDKGKGSIATVLVQQGTLHIQDPIVAGNTFGRVRSMVSDLGRREKAVGPSGAVEITGLNDVPQAGDHFAVFEDEKSARAAGEERFKRAQLIQRQNTRRVSVENLFDTLKEGQLKKVNIIIKADVQGTAEALAASLQKIVVEGVAVDIVHSAVGAINESDVSLATASSAIIIGFNVRPTIDARAAAERESVDIRLHSIIYNVIDEVETAMKGLLDPEYKEEVIGEAIVREVFTVAKLGSIAGFLVVRGKVQRDASVRVIRDSVVIHDGPINSLKHFKDDVKEVGNAQEGGLMMEDYNDFKIDDTFEVYKMVEIKR